MTLEKHDLALMTARFGACRFGATRFGFIPCPEDVVGPPDVDPGLYVWREQTPESQIVDTVWALQNEDCTCRDLCTLAISSMSVLPDPPISNATVTITIPLGGVLGLISGVVRLHWGDGQHDEYIVETLEAGDLEYGHIYLEPGPFTISVDITDERGCRADASLAITVETDVGVESLYFTWDQPAESENITFTAHYSNLTPISYDWDFGEGLGYELDIDPTLINTYPGFPDPDDTYLVKLRINAVEGVFEDTFLMTTNWAAGQSGSSQ